MIAISRRALSESRRMAATWSERFGAAAPDVHVNVSGRQLESGHLSNDVLAALGTHSVPADRLVLELTETRVPTIADSLRKGLNELRERGVRIAIDDIGTGHSSLTRITELPVDMLKIDIKFVRGLGVDRACDAIVRAVLSLGHTTRGRRSAPARGRRRPPRPGPARAWTPDGALGTPPPRCHPPPRPVVDREMRHMLAAAV
jgi:EAL domain-containing protein (putative c-di-GMP-specific phosphodiesterase class I)